jgi:translation elongation factor EF-Ts
MSTPISAELVKKLRDRTGAGMMECKAALQEAHGDLEEATTILRKRGLATAAKKTGRSTGEGLIGSYIHLGGKIGVLVELNCESDFVARTDDFQTLLKEIGLQVAAASPQYVRREDVPAEILDRERGIYRGQAGKLLRAGLPGRSTVDSRPEDHRRPDDPGDDREARREHQRGAVRALQGGRIGIIGP